MSHSVKAKGQSQLTEVMRSLLAEACREHLHEILATSLKQQGFAETLKSLNKGKLTSSKMITVEEGVAERKDSGLYDLALQFEDGPFVAENVSRSNVSTDPQLIPVGVSSSVDSTEDFCELTSDQILDAFANADGNPSCNLLYAVELTRFDSSQQKDLLPLLWKYILEHRDSNDRGELASVGASVRKYIAIMPMDRMGELAVLLEADHRTQLPIELEIEVAKMIYRNFEVHPPVVEDPHPELAKRLFEIVQAYINPRVLLRDKHSAATSLAIEAIVSMRSPLAEQVCQAASTCPYRWFAELVSDDLDNLHDSWSDKSPDATAWLRELLNNVFSCLA